VTFFVFIEDMLFINKFSSKIVCANGCCIVEIFVLWIEIENDDYEGENLYSIVCECDGICLA
jgi:hypothetical protein